MQETHPMQVSTVDLIIFIVFILATIAFGSSFAGKNKSASDFTKGGGKMPGFIVGMSIFATYVSSISFLALPGNAYMTNWNSLVFSLSIPIATWIAVKWFVPFYRNIESVSAYSFLEEKFGRWARIYAASCYLLTQIARIGSVLFLLALPLNAMLGWSVPAIIIITTISVTIYSVLGGIKAVIWTDAIQGIILILGVLVTVGILLSAIPGGTQQFVQTGLQYSKFSLGSFELNAGSSTFWVMLLYGIFINLQNYGIDQNYVQRYKSAKDLKSARFSATFGGLLYVPVSFLFFVIGTGLYVYYFQFPDLLPGGLKSDQVFPYFIVNEMPVGFVGLLIAAVFSAGMSTISTSINSSATVILTDFFRRGEKEALKTLNEEKPYEGKESAQPASNSGSDTTVNISSPDKITTESNRNKTDMKILHLTSAILGLTGMGVALAMMSVQSALDAWWKLAGIFSGGMLGLFLLGFLSKRSNSISALAGVIVGVVLIAWISLSGQTIFHTYLTIVIGTLSILLTGIIISKLFSKKLQRS